MLTVHAILPVKGDPDIREVAGMFEVVQTYSTLDLLKTVDGVCDHLNHMVRLFRPVTARGFETAERVRAHQAQPGGFLDPDDVTIDQIEVAANAFKRMLPDCIAAKATIDSDPDLKPYMRERLHAAFEEAIEAISDIIFAAEAVRDAIVAHDMAADPLDGPVYTNAEDLIAALRG